MAGRLFSMVSKPLLRRKYRVENIITQRHAGDEKAKKGKGMVLGLYQKEGKKEARLTPAGEKVNETSRGQLMEQIKRMRMNGELGKGKIFGGLHPEFDSIAVVGLGREGIGFNELEMLDVGMENTRVAAGVGARSLQMFGTSEIHVDPMDYPEQAAEGAALATWRYDMLKNPRDRIGSPKLETFDTNDPDAWSRGLFKAESQNLARRLSESPANFMTPTIFAENTVEALCPCGITVEVRTMEWIEQQHLTSFLMIAKGSCEPPVLLELNYCGSDPLDKPVLLIGKGCTFNSGGINLRPPIRAFDEYRGAMAGAAIVVAVMRAVAALSLPINVSAVIPLCENMPSGMSVKPGDVVTLLNGKTMAIRDLDKAGVAILADPMIYAQIVYKPRLIVDVATLGEGVKKALGGGATGIFSNSHYVFKQFQKAGALTGDRVWRLPLWKFYKKLVTNNVSFDISNNGRGPASSCIAAAVLHEVVPCMDWAHLDIRGVGLQSKFGTVPYISRPYMTGRPTRTIIQFLYQLACPSGTPEHLE